MITIAPLSACFESTMAAGVESCRKLAASEGFEGLALSFTDPAAPPFVSLPQDPNPAHRRTRNTCAKSETPKPQTPEAQDGRQRHLDRQLDSICSLHIVNRPFPGRDSSE